MTDQPASQYQAAQQAAAQAREDLASQAFGTAGQAPVTDEDIAAQAPSGMGVTEADMDALKAYFERQFAALAAQVGQARGVQAAKNPVASLAGSLSDALDVHADPVAAQLGKDAVDAARNGLDSGDMGPLSKIVSRISTHLARHRPHPGENYHYRLAKEIAGERLPDAIDAYVPPPSAAPAVGSSLPPAKVVAGSVTG
jgi:hypothetical protein